VSKGRSELPVPPVTFLIMLRTVWTTAAQPGKADFSGHRNAWHAARRQDAAAEALRSRKSLDDPLAREAQRLRSALSQYLVTPVKTDVAEVEKMVVEFAGRVLDLYADAPIRTGEGEIRAPAAGHDTSGWDVSLTGGRRTIETIILGKPGAALARSLEEPPVHPPDDVADQALYVLHGGDAGPVCTGMEMVVQTRQTSATGFSDALAKLLEAGSLSLWRRVPAGGQADEWMVRLACNEERSDAVAPILQELRRNLGKSAPRLMVVHNTVVSR